VIAITPATRAATRRHATGVIGVKTE